MSTPTATRTHMSSSRPRNRTLRSGQRLSGRYLLLRRVHGRDPGAWIAEDQQLGDPVEVIVLCAHRWPPCRARQVVSNLQRHPELSAPGLRDRICLDDGRTAVVIPHATHALPLEDAMAARQLVGRRLERQVLHLARQLERAHRSGLAVGSDAFVALRWCRIQGQGWSLVLPTFWGQRERPMDATPRTATFEDDMVAMGLVLRHLDLSCRADTTMPFPHARAAWLSLVERMLTQSVSARDVTLAIARLCLTGAAEPIQPPLTDPIPAPAPGSDTLQGPGTRSTAPASAPNRPRSAALALMLALALLAGFTVAAFQRQGAAVEQAEVSNRHNALVSADEPVARMPTSNRVPTVAAPPANVGEVGVTPPDLQDMRAADAHPWPWRPAPAGDVQDAVAVHAESGHPNAGEDQPRPRTRATPRSPAAPIERRPVELLVESDLPARVLLEGEEVGTTPWRGRVTEGSRVVRTVRDGASRMSVVDARPGAPAMVRHTYAMPEALATGEEVRHNPRGTSSTGGQVEPQPRRSDLGGERIDSDSVQRAR